LLLGFISSKRDFIAVDIIEQKYQDISNLPKELATVEDVSELITPLVNHSMTSLLQASKISYASVTSDANELKAGLVLFEKAIETLQANNVCIHFFLPEGIIDMTSMPRLDH